MTDSPLEIFRYFLGRLKPVSIMVITILATQIAGAILGMVRAPTGFVPLDMWYGSAYATPVGFLIGLLLQGVMSPAGIKERWSVVAFFAAASILLPLFGYFMFDTWQSEFSQ